MWISLTDAAQVDMPMYESKAPTRKLLQCMLMDLPGTWVWFSTKPYELLMLLRVWLQMCLGLESPLANDIMLASRWSTVRAWFWKRTADINVLELCCVELRLCRKEACLGTFCEFPGLCCVSRSSS